MLTFFNENFGRYLTEQTGNPAADAQRANCHSRRCAELGHLNLHLFVAQNKRRKLVLACNVCKEGFGRLPIGSANWGGGRRAGVGKRATHCHD